MVSSVLHIAACPSLSARSYSIRSRQGRDISMKTCPGPS